MSNAKTQTLANINWGDALRYRKHYGGLVGGNLAAISNRGDLQSIAVISSQAIVTAKALERWLSAASADSGQRLCLYHNYYCLGDEATASPLSIEAESVEVDDVFADVRFISSQHYLQGSYAMSPANLASRDVQAGVLIDLEVRQALSDRPEGGKSSTVTWVLDQIDQKLGNRGEADEWLSILDGLVEDSEEERVRVLQWLQQGSRQPRLVWYCMRLLQSRGVAGLDEFALNTLKQGRITEAAVGAVIVLRAIGTQSALFSDATSTILAIIGTFEQRPSVVEESVEETLLTELLETASVLGDETSFQRIAPFWRRRWSFKVRVRALAAAQVIVVRFANTSKIDDALSSSWHQLEQMVIALFESYNMSNTARALTHKIIDLLLARLGPEVSKVIKMGERVPELQRRIARSIKAAEAALEANGKQDWLATQRRQLIG